MIIVFKENPMNKIDREIFVFYNKEDELYQVALSEEETEVIIQVLLSLHNGRVKILPDQFCGIINR